MSNRIYSYLKVVLLKHIIQFLKWAKHTFLWSHSIIFVLSFVSALGDIKISEVNVKGLFMRLINSSLDKELEIGGHILQQNVNGQTVSFYRFHPNIIMQANCTVTVSMRYKCYELEFYRKNFTQPDWLSTSFFITQSLGKMWFLVVTSCLSHFVHPWM